MSSPIPAVIAALSLGYLSTTGQLVLLKDAFFLHLTIPERICLTSAALSILYVVLSISNFFAAINGDGDDDDGGGHDHDETDIYAAYPYERMQLAPTPELRFRELLPTLLDEMVEKLQSSKSVPKDAIGRIRKMVEQSVANRGVQSGMHVVNVRQQLVQDRWRRETLHFLEEGEATALGWVVELFLAGQVVANEAAGILLRPATGLAAVNANNANDALFLESVCFDILRSKFHDNDKSYLRLLEIFLEAKESFELGRYRDSLSLEKTSSGTGRNHCDTNMASTAVTALYQEYLPLAVAMAASDMEDESDYVTVKESIVSSLAMESSSSSTVPSSVGTHLAKALKEVRTVKTKGSAQ